MCRGNLDENDHFSTMQVLRVVENERSALNSPDIRMEVQLSEDFSLLAEFEIRQTMRDMKMMTIFLNSCSNFKAFENIVLD